MIKKFQLLFWVFSLFCSCSSTSKHSRLAHGLIDAFSKKMKNTQHLYCYGKGGALSNDVKTIMLSYVGYQRFNVEQSRKLYINIVEDFLLMINSNAEINPYLHSHPFSINNLELGLAFYAEKDKFIEQPYIAYVLIVNEIIYYCVNDPSKTDNSLKVVSEEPYVEALKIVRGNSDAMD